MKKIKSFLIALLAIAMVLSSVACSSKSSDSGETDSNVKNETTTTTDSGAKAEKVTIEFWHQQQETSGGPALTALVKEFNETNGKGIIVQEVTYGDYTQLMTAMQAALAGGNPPAIAAVNYANLNYINTNFPYVSPRDVIEKYFPEDKDYLSTVYEDAILNLGVGINGDLVGLPYGLSIPIMYYNLDILKEAGLDTENLPRTWQEVRKYAETIVQKTNKHGLYIQMLSDTYSIIPLFYAAGIDEMYVKDGNGYKAQFNTPKVVEVWSFMQEMYKNGSAIYVTNDEGLAAFAGGELAMYLTSCARLKGLMESGVNLQTYYHPKYEGSELAVCLGGNMLTLWSKEEAKQKAAWEFAKFLLEPDNIGLFDTATGYVPPVNGVTANDWELMNNPLIARLLDERSAARPWTSWPGKSGAQIDLQLVSMRDRICVNFEDVAKVVAETEAEINRMLNQQPVQNRKEF